MRTRNGTERFPPSSSRGRLARCVAAAVLGVSAFQAAAEDSRCFGTPANGRLEGGVSLPLSGDNFESYSSAGWALGRTHVHSKVRAVLLDAYASLAKSAPGKVFVYGETGWARGGRFRPHKTHQNGLSVDLMVPVLREGRSVPLPGHALNRYGYDIEFDDRGEFDDYRIDFEALAELIYQIHRASSKREVGVGRVIFEVPLQAHLWTTARGEFLRKNVVYSTRQAWVRHDQHIHIDFNVSCGPM